MKIADFGLARGVHHIDYYKKTSNVRGRAEMRGSGRGGAGMEGTGAMQLSTILSASLLRAACQSSGWLLRPCLTVCTHTRVMCESGNWDLRHQLSSSLPSKRARHLPKSQDPRSSSD